MRPARFLRVLLVTLLATLAATPAHPALAATDLPPDLGMAQLTDLQIDKTADGRRLLRFSATIVNVGAGPFEVHAQRADTTKAWVVEQRVYADSGAFRTVGTPATLVFGGDGHNHWHIRNPERYELERLDNGAKVGTGAKSGFCFYDNVPYRLTLPHAPQAAVYTTATTCKGGPSGLETRMGLSVGWGDRYSYRLPDQYIDITGLTAGRYRLWATADPDNWFVESDNANNVTWVDIQLKGNKVSVIGYGPTA
jgi:hypothetical protein